MAGKSGFLAIAHRADDTVDVAKTPVDVDGTGMSTASRAEVICLRAVEPGLVCGTRIIAG
jgi:hypothetical protein